MALSPGDEHNQGTASTCSEPPQVRAGGVPQKQDLLLSASSLLPSVPCCCHVELLDGLGLLPLQIQILGGKNCARAGGGKLMLPCLLAGMSWAKCFHCSNSFLTFLSPYLLNGSQYT